MAGLRELTLFAGAGGGILGGHMLGWRTVCAVEIDPYAASVLVARQNDGFLPPFPIWDDVCTFDGRPWRGIVDVVSGGFPCQDISVAGTGAGIDGERSGLWREMARIIREVRPRFAFVENSPALVSRGLGTVLGDLAEMGFDARWGVYSAAQAGAPHLRERIWIVASDRNWRRSSGKKEAIQSRGNASVVGAHLAAYADGVWEQQPQRRERAERRWSGNRAAALSDADGAGQREQWRAFADGAQHATSERGDWWASEPDVVRMVHGVPARVDRIRALGNAQVPHCAAMAWQHLMARVVA